MCLPLQGINAAAHVLGLSAFLPSLCVKALLSGILGACTTSKVPYTFASCLLLSSPYPSFSSSLLTPHSCPLHSFKSTPPHSTLCSSPLLLALKVPVPVLSKSVAPSLNSLLYSRSLSSTHLPIPTGTPLKVFGHLLLGRSSPISKMYAPSIDTSISFTYSLFSYTIYPWLGLLNSILSVA